MRKKHLKICCKVSAILTFMFSTSGISNAASHSIAANPARLSINTDWIPNTFNDNDSISFNGNYAIILDRQNGGVNSIDLNGWPGSEIFVQNPVSIGNIFTSSQNLFGVPVQFTSNVPLILIGDDYSGVTNIALITNLSSNNGDVIFKNTYNAGNFNITFDLGTPTLKLNTVGIRQDPVTHYTITTVLKAGHKIYANEFQLAPSDPPYNRMDSVLELEDDTILDATLTTQRLDQNGNIYNWTSSGSGNYLSGGSLMVDEGAIITGQIGTLVNPLYIVTFASNNKNKQVNLGGSIYSEYIYIYQPTIVINNDATYNSTIIAVDPTLNLQNHTLIIQNDDSLYNFGNGPSDFSGDATLATTVTDTAFGRIIVNGAGESIDLSQLNSLSVILTGLTTTIPGPQGRTYTMLGTVTNGGAIILPPDNIVSLDSSGNTNPFVEWSYGQGVLTEMPKPSNNIPAIITQIISNSGGNSRTISNSNILTNPQNINSAAALRNDIITAAIVNPSSLNEMVSRLEPVIVEASEATHTSSLEAVRTISERISYLSALQNSTLAQSEGMSAGNEKSEYGAWVSGYYSKAIQRGSNDKPGYNSITAGGTLGADKVINDTTTLGLAVSLMSVKMKHSNSNFGDRTASSGQLVSLYGLKNLTANWFFQVVASAGSYKIHNKERRYNGLNYEIAKGNYRTFNYGAEVMLGRDFNIKDSLIFTPLLGLSYYSINKDSYQESGTTNQNLYISKHSDQKCDGILGAKLTGIRDWNGITLFPEIHGLLRYDLINKNSKTRASLDGLVDPLIRSTRQEGRTFINLGLGVNAVNGRMEYGLTYDNYLSKKYVGHQGTLKLRYNFN